MTKHDIALSLNYYNQEVARVIGVPEMNIRLEFSKSAKKAGTCQRLNHSEAIIHISTVCAELRPEHDTKNTIVHELCHAYNSDNDGHGYSWKLLAKKVGDALGFKITRLYQPTEAQNQLLEAKRSAREAVGIIEVPEINFKQKIYRKGRAYKMNYNGWYLRKDGVKYQIKFTKLA